MFVQTPLPPQHISSAGRVFLGQLKKSGEGAATESPWLVMGERCPTQAVHKEGWRPLKGFSFSGRVLSALYFNAANYHN